MLQIKGKGKVFQYSLPSVGPGADPGLQAVSPQVTCSHPPGGRLPFTFRQACGYLPSRRTSPPIGRYQFILLGDRGIISVSEHVTNIISKCAQSVYEIKVLRCQGMSEDILVVVFKSVVLAKILYASPAWRGFAKSSDKQRLEAFLRRCIQLHLYQQCDPTVTQLVEHIEDKLFTNVLNDDQHVRFYILPDHS